MTLSAEASQPVECFQWLTEEQSKNLSPEHINTTQGMFVTRVVGESMNKRIINGSWCLFKANPGGSRNGKIVLVQHRDIEDPDHGGTYTVKTYYSEKIEEDGVLVNQRIVLKPETNAYGYSPIVINNDSEGLVIIGEYLCNPVSY